MQLSKIVIIGLMSMLLVQCSSSTKKEVTSTPIPPPTVATPAVPDSPPVPVAVVLKDEKSEASSKELDELKITLKKAEAIVAKDANSAAHSEHNRKAGNVSSEKALGWLKNGNTRFKKGFFRKDGAGKKDVERVTNEQKPHSIILSCSDSRVPPEVVFDQKLGELYVIRTAGESLDSAVIASIEYAVEHLGSNLLVVMGHSSCDAVKASFKTSVGGDTGSPHFNALVADMQPRIAGRMKGPASENFITEGWDNARGVAQTLLEKSKVIRDAAKSGSLRVETALYHLESGTVEWNK